MTHLSRILLALFIVCLIATAQVSTARLEGVVQDTSGAVVPNARVTVVNARTQVRAETTADPEGLFAFASLQPSIYTLTVEAAGFRTTVVSNLELNVSATVSQLVNLEVGAVTDRVVVQAPAERVQIADGQIARATTLRDIEVLPQLSRGVIGLAVFNPGVQIDPSGLSTRVNGARRGSTNSKLDGIDITASFAPALGVSVIPHNPDSVEEFRIVTSGGKAEYGYKAGGQIEMITRSGGNSVHGNLFEYHRNTALNANTFFGNSSGLSRPVFIQNTFGGSLGGPIRRDRTFIFGNFQARRTAEQTVVNRTVLTPQAKAGLFRWRTPGSSEIESFDIVRNDPRGKGIDPKVAEILKLLPDPNNYHIGDTLNTAGFRFNNAAGSGLDLTDEFTIKADHNVWSGHRVFFRWAWQRTWYIDNFSLADATFPGQPPGMQGGPQWGYSIGSDWAITSRVVNELRAGYKSVNYRLPRPARLRGPMLMANSWTDPLGTQANSETSVPVRHIADNFTAVRGKHTFKAGLDWRFTRQRNSNESGIWPDVRFATTDAAVPAGIGPSGIRAADRQTFENLYNDLLGRMSQVTQTFFSDLEKFQPAGTPRVRNYRFRDYGYFFQDDWKLHPRFVLNLGLRYEFAGAPFEANHIEGTVDKAALINHAARIDNLTIQRSGRLYAGDWNNFAPRAGFAWDLTGDGKTALRGNWGIFYDRLIGATVNFVFQNTPGASQRVSEYPNLVPPSDVRVSDGIPLPQQPPLVLCPPANRSTDLFLFSPNLRTGYVQHYGLNLQREVFRNTVVEAGYVGTRGVKLFMDLNLNQPRIYEDFLNAFRELQTFGARGTPVSASNTLVRIFGSPTEAIIRIGGSVLDRGAVGSAADSMDRSSDTYTRYPQAGISDFYLRNFPQFGRVVIGGNDGRSYYDSFQFSLRRQAGALKFVANYTFSKSMDNISTDGYGFTSPIDNFNVRLNRARGDLDIPHAFNSSFIYTLPIGKGRRFAGHAPRWVDSAVGGWDVGLLATWQSGRPLTYLSGRATGPTTSNSFANYTGDRNIGQVTRKGDGVYWLTPDEISRFSVPAAGEIGTGGRNAFRGPRFFNLDLSLVKKFKLTERRAVSFRAEAYNLFNNANFGAPNANLATPATFGKIPATVGNARIFQMALRYDF
jgi:hypothetical protein